MKIFRLGPGQFDILCAEKNISGKQVKWGMVIGMGYYDSTRFDANAMVEAYREVLRRNDGLRVRILEKSLYRWRQYIADYAEPQLEYHTLEGGREAFKRLCDTIQTPYIPYQNADLCRAEIYSCSDGTGGIVLWQHHACSDGYTMANVIYRQLCEFYVAYKNGEQPAPPKRLYSFEECIAKRQELVRKRGLQDAAYYVKDVWRNILHYSYPTETSLRIKEQIKHDVLLNGEEYSAYMNLCKELKCPAMSILMSIASVLALKYSKNAALC